MQAPSKKFYCFKVFLLIYSKACNLFYGITFLYLRGQVTTFLKYIKLVKTAEQVGVLHSSSNSTADYAIKQGTWDSGSWARTDTCPTLPPGERRLPLQPGASTKPLLAPQIVVLASRFWVSLHALCLDFQADAADWRNNWGSTEGFAAAEQ